MSSSRACATNWRQASSARRAGRPLLLGIPGDNTFSNYQEAQRAFWRSTVLPLANRTAKALASDA